MARNECLRINELIDQIYGYYAIQIGEPQRNLLACSAIANRYRVGRSRNCDLRCDYHSLPVESSTADLVLIAHALEFSSYPEAIMREAFRVLRPEGHLLVIGFSPTGLFGIRNYFDLSGGYPWYGEFVSQIRVRDWCAVLGLTQLHGSFLGYAPPGIVQSERTFDLCEKMGDRWWPLLGAVYILQAIKRVPAMRRIKLSWKSKARELGLPVKISG